MTKRRSTIWRTWREDAGGTLAIAVMASAAWMLVVEPASDARRTAADIRVSTDLVQSQVAMVQAQVRSAQADLDAAHAEAGPVHPLRRASQFNSVLAALNQAAVESGFTLEQIMPGAVERHEAVERHRLSVSGRGTYVGAIAFLETLRTEFPDVTVLAVSASRTESDDRPAALVSLELAWHAQAEPGAKQPRH